MLKISGRVFLLLALIFSLSFCTPFKKTFLHQVKKDEVTKEQVVEKQLTTNPVAAELPSGDYKLDKAHASLIFKVDHLGFSNYTARFKRFDADLKFDSKNPSKSKVTAIIDPTSIETDYPDSKNLDFNAELYGEKWLDAARFPQIKFRSTKIEMIDSTSALITGELSLHGFKKKIVMEAKFNGGYKGHPMDPNARIGFSAKGYLDRSDFGIVYGIPAKGTKMGVSDRVDFILEVEFTKKN